METPGGAEIKESKVRLHKWLSIVGYCSLRKAEELIRQGKVLVDGQVAVIGQDIDESQAAISVNGVLIPRTTPAKLYFMLYKPVGTLTSFKNDNGFPCLADLAEIKKLKVKLNPVGRLDCYSEGLLLLTNDGQLCHRLMHPRYKVSKMYRVESHQAFPNQAMREIEMGLTLDDGPVSAQIRPVASAQAFQYDIALSVGRNRIVRRIFEHYGLQVRRLIRIAVGEISLDPKLAPGQLRPLSPHELEYLFQIL